MEHTGERHCGARRFRPPPAYSTAPGRGLSSPTPAPWPDLHDRAMVVAGALPRPPLAGPPRRRLAAALPTHGRISLTAPWSWPDLADVRRWPDLLDRAWPELPRDRAWPVQRPNAAAGEGRQLWPVCALDNGSVDAREHRAAVHPDKLSSCAPRRPVQSSGASYSSHALASSLERTSRRERRLQHGPTTRTQAETATRPSGADANGGGGMVRRQRRKRRRGPGPAESTRAHAAARFGD